MGHEALKMELIAWLSALENDSALEYLKSFKESLTNEDDWWNEISAQEKAGIERGLQDVDNGRVIPYEEVVRKYGL